LDRLCFDVIEVGVQRLRAGGLPGRSCVIRCRGDHGNYFTETSQPGAKSGFVFRLNMWGEDGAPIGTNPRRSRQSDTKPRI
jgi:hypothetical protein